MWTIAGLVKLSAPVLVRMAIRGELSREHLWTAMRGAETYRDAVARGDVASDTLRADRGAKCAACELAVRVPSQLSDTEKVYCGQPFTETARTCGCLVGVTVNGVFEAGGKPSVRSSSCTDGRW